jgi:ParB family chromosome partitioning protein
MIAQRVGKSRAAITNSLRLLQLSPGVQNSIHLGQISAGHARALLGLNDRSLQEDIAKRIASDGLSVRETENLIKNITNPDDETNTTTEAVDDEISNKDENLTGTKMSNVRPPGLYELEALLAEKLSTSVKVQLNGKRGKVVIDFATLEDLERIYRLMFSQLT